VSAWLVAPLVSFAACSNGVPARQTEVPSASTAQVSESVEVVTRPLFRLALVDSADYGGDMSFILHKVQVARATRTDTIPGILVQELPALGADGKLYGIAFKKLGALNRAYVYDPDTRTVSDLPLPPVLELLVARISMSRDARHLAYLWYDTADVGLVGVVRSWPDGKILVQTTRGSGTDQESPPDGLRWLDTKRVEMVYPVIPVSEKSGQSTGRKAWIHAIVNVDTRQVSVDTVGTPPEWVR
jgi:hypothetical protein